MYKFEKLEVWQLAIEYTDVVYEIAERLPQTEKYNLASQIRRAATSVTLNIAEGSTSQIRRMAIRSLIETVACQHLISRREYLEDQEQLRTAYRLSEELFAKLQAFKQAVERDTSSIRELETQFEYETDTPF